MNEIFLDTETTGLSFKSGHKIVEIACVETKDFIPTGRVFHKLINPKREVSKDAYEIHGYSTEFLENKETFGEIANEFLNFISEKKIIIHNAPFDIGFLNGELGLINKELMQENINKIETFETMDNRNNTEPNMPGEQSEEQRLHKMMNLSGEEEIANVKAFDEPLESYNDDNYAPVN